MPPRARGAGVIQALPGAAGPTAWLGGGGDDARSAVAASLRIATPDGLEDPIDAWGLQDGVEVKGRGRPTDSEAGADPEEHEVLEFLEGLLEGFRAAASSEPGAPATGWSELDDLAPAGKRGATGATGVSPVSIAVSADPVSTLMRRHALRTFLEETCGTVASAFDVLAGLALRGISGGPGTNQDRLRHEFSPSELRRCLTQLGYGAAAAEAWWEALFVSVDVDGDGRVSLQDMYDALVLYLPAGRGADEASSEPVAGGSSGEIFWAAAQPEGEQLRRALAAPRQR